MAYNYDTRETREIPCATRTLINCDETFTLQTTVAEDPTGRTNPPPQKEYVPQIERMFPEKKPEDLTSGQLYTANKEDGPARRALNPRSEAIILANLKTGTSERVGY